MKNQDSSFSIVKYEIIGVAPLVQHNGQTADPLNKFSKMLKALSSKRNKTDADYLELSRVEFHAGLYTNEESKIVVPSKNLSACLVGGAKKSKLGNQFKSGVFIFEDAPLVFDDADKTPTELWDMGEKYVLRTTVGVNGSSVLRTRPIFKSWKLKVSVNFNPDLVDEQQITQAMQDAGIQCGLCDWTPQNGRFIVKKISDVVR